MQGFDLAIRLLTALVLLALTGSMGLLIYRAVAPRLAPAPAPAAASAGGPAQNTAPAPANAGARGDEVMMAPGRVFRCTEQGRPTFSDRACGGRTN
jgi:predicted lipid-binding transport protein (Tim44 family)